MHPDEIYDEWGEMPWEEEQDVDNSMEEDDLPIPQL